MEETNSDVTQLIRAARESDEARERLLQEVYMVLRAIAQKRMGEERAGHTLQATALVHEAYLRMIGREGATFEDRRHFFRACADAMRHILIDHARRHRAAKRGGGKAPLAIERAEVGAAHDPTDLMALDEAMKTLQAEDARAAEVVTLRFYAGLSVEETADVLSVSARTVIREWIFARARLHELLTGEGS